MEEQNFSLCAISVCITLCPWSSCDLWCLCQQALISRNYRGDVDMSMIDKFLPMVLDAEEEGTVSPILIHDKVTFVYIKHNNLYCILVCWERGNMYIVYMYVDVYQGWIGMGGWLGGGGGGGAWFTALLAHIATPTQRTSLYESLLHVLQT